MERKHITSKESRIEREFKKRYVEENIKKLARMGGESFEVKITRLEYFKNESSQPLEDLEESKNIYEKRIEEIDGKKYIIIPSKL